MTAVARRFSCMDEHAVISSVPYIMPRIFLPVALSLTIACRGAEPAPSAWHDPSPHRVAFVTVAPEVRLEVLDWGGSGPPLVFLAGLQDVAHGFDDFAPTFTDTHHVLALTRRGYGASSQPPSGYDLATRLADLRAVLDSLHLQRVTLVGHSMAGDELTGFAGAYPERVDRLVYLDAAYDHSALGPLLADYPAPPPMTQADSASPAAVQAYLLRTFGMHIPEGQVRAIGRYDAAGRLVGDVTPATVDSAMLAGCGRPDYARVRAPALALNSIADSAAQIFPAWPAMSESQRVQARRFAEKLRVFGNAERERVQRELRGARVLAFHGANHYLFDSNEAEVTRAMRAFLAEH